MSWSLKSFFRCVRSPWSAVPLENIVMIRPPSMASAKSDPPLTSVIKTRNESGERTVLIRTIG